MCPALFNTFGTEVWVGQLIVIIGPPPAVAYPFILDIEGYPGQIINLFIILVRLFQPYPLSHNAQTSIRDCSICVGRSRMLLDLSRVRRFLCPSGSQQLTHPYSLVAFRIFLLCRSRIPYVTMNMFS